MALSKPWNLRHHTSFARCALLVICAIILTFFPSSQWSEFARYLWTSLPWNVSKHVRSPATGPRRFLWMDGNRTVAHQFPHVHFLNSLMGLNTHLVTSKSILACSCSIQPRPEVLPLPDFLHLEINHPRPIIKADYIWVYLLF